MWILKNSISLLETPYFKLLSENTNNSIRTYVCPTLYDTIPVKIQDSNALYIIVTLKQIEQLDTNTLYLEEILHTRYN